MKNTKYKIGETIIPNNCNERCICTESGVTCVPLCPVVNVNCKEGEKLEYVVNKVDKGSNCTCQIPTCKGI